MFLEFTPVAAIKPTDTGSSITPAIVRTKSIDEAFEEFLNFEVANGAASSDTIANYKSQLRLFLQWCIDYRLNPLLADRKQIQQYRSYLIKDKNYKIATIELKLQVVKRFYAALIEHKLVERNPAVGIKAPRERRSEDKIQYLSLEQLQQLLSLVDGNDSKLKRDRLILGLMALQGLRTVEVQRLNFGDLFQRDGRYLINVSSKRAVRETKLREDVCSWLLDHLVGKKLSLSLPIITSFSGNNYGKRISRDGLRRIVNGYLGAIGLRGGATRLSNHSLRHTFGTQVYAATKDIRLVQKAMGHGSTRTTSKYVHLVEDIAAADFIPI